MKLDHVALGVGDHRKALAALTGELGGLVISGGEPPRAGFRAMQVRLGRGTQGMTVEVLEPHDVEHNDFLVRFLEAGGDRPHHVTFKVDDIEAELERLRDLGIEPVAIDFRHSSWREMFIHPRASHGTVIQIAESDIVYPPIDEWLATLPESIEIFDGLAWWEEAAVRPPPPEPVDLLRVVIATPDRASGDDFHHRILGSDMERSDEFTDHCWPGGTIRLVDADVDRPRVSHLEITGDRDLQIAGTRFVGVGG